jgi:hypothetical protein
VTNAIASTMMSVVETDSLGRICLRTFAQQAETVEFSRPGYREASLTVSGVPGQAVARDLRLERVPRPCCDLRGQWSITLQLDSPGARQPKPKARSVTGAVNLGPSYLAAGRMTTWTPSFISYEVCTRWTSHHSSAGPSPGM